MGGFVEKTRHDTGLRKHIELDGRKTVRHVLSARGNPIAQSQWLHWGSVFVVICSLMNGDGAPAQTVHEIVIG
jgi:hypothetical protein